MGALDFTEIPTAASGASRDSFELFTREFLVEAGYEVVAGPDRGADGGRDLIVVERRIGPGGLTQIHWLVSCKHYAHGGKSVSPGDEGNIRDRLETHSCNGFMPFYSTLPSSTHSGAVMQQRSIPHLISDERATTDTTIVDN